MVLELPALPVDEAEEAEPVELAVDDEPEPEVLEEPLPLLLVAAPKIPPWTVAGDEPCALAAADLYASRVFAPLDLFRRS